MGFYLHQDMRRLLMVLILAFLRVGVKASHFRAFHYRRVVFVG